LDAEGTDAVSAGELGTETRSHAGAKLKTAAMSAAAMPHSPSRCRRAGWRVQRIATRASNISVPPPIAL
jgi:hypothetical protein